MKVRFGDLCGALAACPLLLSLRAEVRFQERLLMQWSVAAKPSWSAPRRIAPSLVPALATASLLTLAILAHTGAEEDADSMTAPPVLMAAAFLAGHGLHLRLIAGRGWPRGGERACKTPQPLRR